MDNIFKNILYEMCDIVICSKCSLLTPVEFLGVFIGSTYFQGKDYIDRVCGKSLVCISCFKTCFVGRAPVHLDTTVDIAELREFRELLYDGESI